jgi:hypothetical protein
MNRTYNLHRLSYLFILLGAAVTLLLSAPTADAQGKKDTRGKKAKGEPFTNVKSNRRFFRVVAEGVSTRKDFAEKKATQGAQAKIASEIAVVVKQVNEDYAKETSTDAGDEYMQSFESMTRTVINQTLYGANVVDKGFYSFYKTKEDKKAKKISYRVYVVMEMDRDKYLAALAQAASGDENKKLNYNKAKYEETFDKEMAAYSGSDDTSVYVESEDGGEWDATDEEPANK